VTRRIGTPASRTPDTIQPQIDAVELEVELEVELAVNVDARRVSSAVVRRVRPPDWKCRFARGPGRRRGAGQAAAPPIHVRDPARSGHDASVRRLLRPRRRARDGAARAGPIAEASKDANAIAARIVRDVVGTDLPPAARVEAAVLAASGLVDGRRTPA
jgi:hypothetical protein